MERVNMLRIIIIFLILWTQSDNLYAQLSFKINKLTFSNVVIETDQNVIDEDMENGPYASFDCVITNRSNDAVTLFPSKSQTTISFNYKEVSYTNEVFPMPFIDRDSLVLQPDQNTSLVFSTPILLGTPMMNVDSINGDYTGILRAIKPQLEITYKDPSVEIRTDEIKHVEWH